MNAGEDVLVFYNDKSSFSHFVSMMRSERHRMDESSALRYLATQYSGSVGVYESVDRDNKVIDNVVNAFI